MGFMESKSRHNWTAGYLLQGISTCLTEIRTQNWLRSTRKNLLVLPRGWIIFKIWGLYGWRDVGGADA